MIADERGKVDSWVSWSRSVFGRINDFFLLLWCNCSQLHEICLSGCILQAGSLLKSASAGKARWPELTASELAALAAIVLAFLYIEAYRGFYKVRWLLAGELALCRKVGDTFPIFFQ